jgi:hypothetical protein
MSCECDGETEVTETVSREPHTGREHRQYICTERGEPVDHPDQHKMI